MTNFITYVVGWLLIIVTLWGMAKFSPTRIILYWLLWISIVWLLIANSDELSSLMNSVFQSGSSSSSGNFGTGNNNTTNSQSQTTKGK